MKRMISSKRIIRIPGLILPLIFFFLSAPLFGQTDTTKEEAVTPFVTFISIQKSDNTVDLKASYKAKMDGNLTRLQGLPVSFSLVADSAENKIGEAVTDARGVALFNCKTETVTPDKEGKLHFKASFAGNSSVEASSEEVTVKRASLVMTPVKEDSILSVQLKLVDLTSGTETPIPETSLGIYVKRLFYPLKLGEGKTDERGEASVEIPSGIPGDSKGNITLLARLEDNEDYGNLEASAIQTWGTPVSDEVKELPRALWSPHPPLWMLITFIILMTAVWGHYIVIIYELFRLRKEHPKETIT